MTRPWVSRRQKRKAARERAWDIAHNVRTSTREYMDGKVKVTHHSSIFSYSPSNRLSRKWQARFDKEPHEPLNVIVHYDEDEA